MGFTVPARQIILALALAAAVAACTSSSSLSPASPAPKPSTLAATRTPAVVAQITANWEKFFNGSTPLSQKVALAQDGRTFSTAIGYSRTWPSGLGSDVLGVRLNSANSATVTYSLADDGFSDPAMTGLTGIAVYQNGAWRVSDVSLCAMLKLVQGAVPAACRSVG